MCKCGCNTCETKSTLMLNESLAPRAILSEGLKHHIDNNKPLTEHLYRAGSSAYFNLIAEARSLYSRGILEFTNEDDLAILTETDLGHFGMFEGKKVPLDFPIELNEQMDIYDDIANMEFGMDYDQLGSNEKEWVRDEIDNMEMRESLSEAIYTDPNTGKSYDLQHDSSKNRWELDIIKKDSSIYDKIVTIKRETVEEIIDWLEGYNIDSSWVKKSLNETNKISDDKLMRLMPKIPKGYGGKNTGIGEYTISTPEGEDIVLTQSKDKKNWFYEPSNVALKILNEVTRYSGFNRNPEDPDSIPFEPTGSVSEFREELRALFGKFKGDLKSPEFIKGVAQIMVNWKSLLRSQLNESNSNYPDFDLDKNIRYQDTVITNGMWRYTGKESGGAGVYRNLNNGQFLAFDKNDFDIFRKHLSSHFDFSQSGGPDFSTLNEADDKLLKIKQELESLRPSISWIDDIFVSSYDGSLQVELDYTLYPDEIKQLAQIAAKYGMELKYMTGKNATLVKNRIDEAVKKNTKKLNKPMRDSSGGKAYKVYVKDPKTKKIKTVRFGSGGLRAKINDKKARNAFAKRHKCSTKKDKTKAGYWSCRLPRYAKLLGLKSNFGGFW